MGVAWKLGPWAQVAGPKAKKTGPNQSRSDKARLEPDHTMPDQIVPGYRKTNLAGHRCADCRRERLDKTTPEKEQTDHTD